MRLCVPGTSQRGISTYEFSRGGCLPIDRWKERDCRLEPWRGCGRACIMFTDVVKFGERLKGCAPMKAKKGDGKKMRAHGTARVRATISFPPDVYETLEIIAREKKVS